MLRLRPVPPRSHMHSSRSAATLTSQRRSPQTSDPSLAGQVLRLQQTAGNRAVARIPGVGELLDYLNPRYHVPTWAWGYGARDMVDYTGPVRLLAPELRAAFRNGFRLVPSDAVKQQPHDVTRAEYDAVAQLMLDITARQTKLRVGTTLVDETAAGADALKGSLQLETMRDLIEVARTAAGRKLLTRIARAPGDAPNVFISANELVVAPAANPRGRNLPASTRQVTDVIYTPTAFKAGLAPNSAQNLVALDAAKVNNPWVMPRRSDVTLFHELLHAYHTQRGSAQEKDALVGTHPLAAPEAPVDPVDAPRQRAGIGGAMETAGVSLEEYATVGLGS